MGPLEGNCAEILVSPTEDSPGERSGEPVLFGVPWPRGAVQPSESLELTSQAGSSFPVQATTLEHWSDGSVRWHLVEGSLDFDGPTSLFLSPSSSVPAGPSIELDQSESGSYTVDTGLETFSLRPSVGMPLYRLAADGTERPVGDLVVLDASGARNRLVFHQCSLARRGPLRTVFRCSGRLGRSKKPHLDLSLLIEFFANQSIVKIRLTVRNPRKARHRGGIWELGDANSYLFKELTLELGVENGAGLPLFSPGPEERLAPCAIPLVLTQMASGGENWQSPIHVDRNGTVNLREKGYLWLSGSEERRGTRASPRLLVGEGRSLVGVAIEEFWQNFPSSIAFDGEKISIGFLASVQNQLNELQGGEQKTFGCWLSLGDESNSISSSPLGWCLEPAFVRPTPVQYTVAATEPMMTTVEEGPNPRLDRLVDAGVDGPDSFFEKRERIDEYGWRHFGELWADHEALHSESRESFVSHYNNQYDSVYALGLRFMRTGDRRWWTLMHDLARHVADIDVYHTTQDRAAYSGGLFWHTDHYRDAGLSTHRTYPTGSPGGGHHAEHAYNYGLMLHYYLTGDEVSKASAIEMAQWLESAEDGSRQRTRWIDKGPVGAISITATEGYHGPGRAPANSLLCLIAGYRLSGNRRFLELAEELVRRCCHPADNIAQRQLDKVEKRWSYTMFLYSLGHYLSFKEERDELDETYWYAREALLRYARWMLKHEYVYLDKPEVLEFPNQTWSAQELRKADVLALAGLYSPEERSSFIGRARYFFDRAISSLEQTPERSLTRLLILSLRHGQMPSALGIKEWQVPESRGDSFDFGEPAPFDDLIVRLQKRFPPLFRLLRFARGPRA